MHKITSSTNLVFLNLRNFTRKCCCSTRQAKKVASLTLSALSHIKNFCNKKSWVPILFLPLCNILRKKWNEPHRHLLIESQQWNNQKNECNFFKVNNKDNRMMSLTSFWSLSCYLWIDFTHYHRVSIEFNQVNAS